ncbi:MAG: energy transducer TonB [Crocinitomicaceae bacterium]|nr:energy transducer TonB [Crocinitomicaceae bacterium]
MNKILSIRTHPELTVSKEIVFVQFVVNTDGTLTEIKIVKGVSPLLDAEAKRVVSIMPPWNPGSNAVNM